jgi:hypothetical protein
MANEIEVDDEVLRLLKQEAEPFIDTPNSVLRRLLGLNEVSRRKERVSTETRPSEPRPRQRQHRAARSQARKARSTRAPKGVLLPETEYELPLLSTIVELGGKVPASEVLAALEPKIKPLLKPMDLDALDGSGLVRWKNRAQFCRLKLVQKGDLVAGSPRGVWEISEQGRQRVSRNSER